MKSMRYDFTPPPIVGALGGIGLTAAFARSHERALRECGSQAVCLPFQVERRHLKNLISCMRLMDIEGLIVHAGLSSHLARYLDHLDRMAKSTGLVDTVMRRGNRFVGTSALSRAIDECLKAYPCHVVVVAGTGINANAVRHVLRKLKVKSVRSVPRRIPRKRGVLPLIIDTTRSTHRGPHIVPFAQIERRARAIAVELIMASPR